MKNFKLIFWGDSRCMFYIEEMRDIKCNNGREVVDYIFNECRKDEDWEENIISWFGEWDEDYLIEGDINSNKFNIVIGEAEGVFVLEYYEGSLDENYINDMIGEFLEGKYR